MDDIDFNFMDDWEVMQEPIQYANPEDITVDWGSYYGSVDYSRFDPIFDETLDFIVALPEKGD